jgi:hypothetical protein
LKFKLLILTFILWNISSPAWADSSNPKEGRTLDLGVTGGFPQLIAGEIRIVRIPNFDLGVGFGSFPINSFAHSIYSFPAVPLDLQTGDNFYLVPTGTFSLTTVYIMSRWYPASTGFFLQLGFHVVSFSANISGALENRTLGTSAPGVVSGSVNITQPMLDFGPGYQFLIGDHFHIDIGLGFIYLLKPSSSESIGGSLSSLVVLNSKANENFEAAKANLASDVNNAMGTYQAHVKYLPSIYLTLGYIF